MNGVSMPVFQGYPVVWVPVMPKLLTDQASEVLAYFGDLRQALVYGSRKDLETAVDASRYFEFDQLAVRGIGRFDIVTDEVGTDAQAGSVIALVTPAS